MSINFISSQTATTAFLIASRSQQERASSETVKGSKRSGLQLLNTQHAGDFFLPSLEYLDSHS